MKHSFVTIFSMEEKRKRFKKFIQILLINFIYEIHSDEK